MTQPTQYEVNSEGHCEDSPKSRRGGFSQVSSLDMLTCGLGAFLALCIISMGINPPQRGLVPGVILTFEVDPPQQALIGVRGVTSDGIVWAGGDSGDSSININPSQEGAGTITVVLTGDYQPKDRLYLFVSSLGDKTPVWTDELQEIQVSVTIEGGSRNSVKLEKSQTSKWIPLEGIRQMNALSWRYDESP